MDFQVGSDELQIPHGLAREQIGWLGEHDLDRVNLLNSGGRLHPYLPLFDTRRVDRIYAWNGVEATCFLQAKATGQPRTDGRYSWKVPAAHFVPYDRFWVALCIIDLAAGRLTDPVWLVPSRALAQVAAHGNDPAAGGPMYQLTASPSGHDALARYRTSLSQLWKMLTASVELGAGPLERFPVLHEEQGAFYEYAQIAEHLRESQDDTLLFRAANDIAGRDLLLQQVDTPQVLFLQIKGTARLAETASTCSCAAGPSPRKATSGWPSTTTIALGKPCSRTAGWYLPSTSPA